MSIKDLQQQLILALKAQEAADKQCENEISRYEQALEDWKKQNPELLAAKNTAYKNYQNAALRVMHLRDKLKDELGTTFVDNLPEGLSQKRKKVVKYDPQGFLRVAVDRFPFLVKLDEKAVDNFFVNMAKEDGDGALVLPETIRCWASVEVVYEPLPQISNSKLIKLDPDATRPILAEEIESLADESDEAEQPVDPEVIPF